MIAYCIDTENKNLHAIMDTSWVRRQPKQKPTPNLEDEFNSIVANKLGEVDDNIKKFYSYVFNVWILNDKKLTDENIFTALCDYASDFKALTKTDKAIFINMPFVDLECFGQWAELVEMENRF